MAFQFPDPNVTPEFTGDNGITYSWDATDSKWVVKRYAADLDDRYVNKTGDIMTGPLAMNDTTILIENGELAFTRDGTAAEINDPGSRFSTIKSTAPIDLDTGTFDYSSAFGLQVSVDAGNSFKNKFKVNNRNGDIVEVSGGTGPTVQFGKDFPGNQTGYEPGSEGGVVIKGIPTPEVDNTEPTLAVNKEYVDTRDQFLQQEIIELEEEIEALAPTTERGSWILNLVGTVAQPGQFTMYDDLYGGGGPNGRIKSVKSIWFNELDTDGILHGFGGVEEGDLIELFVDGSPEYGLWSVVGTPHNETDGATKFWVIDVDFQRTLEDNTSFGPGELCRLKIFKAPEGGSASEFVRKSGDEMSGDLTFLSNYNGYHHDATTASTRIEFKNTRDNGSADYTYFYRLGTLDGIACSGQLRCKGSLSVSNDVIGWDASNGAIYNSRIALDSGGGRIKWGSTEIAAWAGGGFYYYGDVTNDRHVATKEYVDDAVEQGTQKYVSSGKRLGEWFSSSSYSEPGDQCSDKGEAKKYINTSELYISFRDRGDVSHEDYFSSLKVGDKLYYQKRDQGNSILEEVAITSIQLDSDKCRIRIKPYDIFEQSTTYILYDGKPQATASVPSPNGYYLSLTGGDSRSAPTDLKITDEYIWKMNDRGDLSTSSSMNGVFIPYAWLKRHYPNFSGFNPMEGINKSFINDGSTNRKGIFDPYGNSSYEILIKSTKFNNVPGIAFYSTSRDISPVSNTPMELYGIQETVNFD